MSGSELLESQIGQWRAALLRGRAIDAGDADELEGHLREQISELETSGLSGDEAFLVAIRRLGEVDAITAEFAREHGDRLWKQLALSHSGDEPRRPILAMLAFAAAAAILFQVARNVAILPGSTSEFFGDPVAAWFFRNASLFVLPVLVGYFALVRRLPWRRVLVLAALVAALALAVNLFPFQADASTNLLVAIHLPVALWFVVGVAYLGGEVRSSQRRMDFIRFTGEWAIYYALIALGGIVLIVLLLLVLNPIAQDLVEPVATWVMSSGAAAAVVVAAWLVEAKKSVIENIAPVLTAIFTPLFAVMLLFSATVYLIVGAGRDFDRDLLTVFDILLLVVLGLVVYGISARDAALAAGWTDVVRLVAVAAAIVLDLLVLYSMFARVGEFGFTANRVAALGLNLLLLVNLAGTAWLIARLLAGRSPAVRLERWQTGYLPVFAAWAVLMILVVPPLFGFA